MLCTVQATDRRRGEALPCLRVCFPKHPWGPTLSWHLQSVGSAAASLWTEKIPTQADTAPQPTPSTAPLSLTVERWEGLKRGAVLTSMVSYVTRSEQKHHQQVCIYSVNIRGRRLIHNYHRETLFQLILHILFMAALDTVLKQFHQSGCHVQNNDG